MKKLKLIVCLFLMALLVTGCDKKLVCTGNLNGMDGEVTFEFDGKEKVKEVKFTVVYDLKKLAKEDKSYEAILNLDDDTIEDVFEAQFEAQFENEEVKKLFGDYDVKVKNKKVTMTIEFSKEVLKEFQKMSYDEIKDQMIENEEMTCK